MSNEGVEGREAQGRPGIDRRRFFAWLGGSGLAATALPGLVLAEAEAGKPITAQTIARAEEIAGLELSDAERELMLKGVNELRGDFAKLRQVAVANDVPPAFRFSVEAPRPSGERRGEVLRWSQPEVGAVPDDLEELAFAPITHLAQLIRTRRVTSAQLTRVYLSRLERHDAELRCVISFLKERALAQAQRADRELAQGRYRGPLHGIPWGVKDLFAVRGQRTTWGATPYRDQVVDMDATVVRRLDEAGAVLLAKLSVGALAWGDVWFDGQTRNPWNREQGSSGSSAGSAAATAAGLVGFAIGTETWGSIISPCTRCGATGLRPTFGRVSRHGAMALSWTMDKVGPIGRSVEDCALVFAAICGPDGEDPTVVDAGFAWDAGRDAAKVRVGFVPALFDAEPEDDEGREWRELDRASLARLAAIGFDLRPIELPELPVAAMSFILNAEAAAAFDELTRSGGDDTMVRQIENAWPNVFRQARLIPAVEYIQANRVRTLLAREMDRILAAVDVYVAPTFGGDNLLLTNLTGHPSVVLPNGFRADGTPTSISFLGRPFAEAALLTVARAYQEATDHHLRHPSLA